MIVKKRKLKSVNISIKYFNISDRNTKIRVIE